MRSGRYDDGRFTGTIVPATRGGPYRWGRTVGAGVPSAVKRRRGDTWTIVQVSCAPPSPAPLLESVKGGRWASPASQVPIVRTTRTRRSQGCAPPSSARMARHGRRKTAGEAARIALISASDQFSVCVGVLGATQGRDGSRTAVWRFYERHDISFKKNSVCGARERPRRWLRSATMTLVMTSPPDPFQGFQITRYGFDLVGKAASNGSCSSSRSVLTPGRPST
jgi:hypothetical protein